MPRHSQAKILLGFVVLLFVGPSSVGHGDFKSDGFYWSKSSDTEKLGFVIGYLTAMTRVMDEEGFRCLAERNGGQLPQQYPGDAALTACTTQNPHLAAYDFQKIALGQLTGGLDEFYKDFRNKTIELNLALIYVRDELRGKPAQELEEELARFRRGATH